MKKKIFLAMVGFEPGTLGFKGERATRVLFVLHSIPFEKLRMDYSRGWL